MNETFVFRYLQQMTSKFNEETGIPSNAMTSELDRKIENKKTIYNLNLVSLKDIQGNRRKENTTLLTIEEDTNEDILNLMINNHKYDLDTLEEKSFIREFEIQLKENGQFIRNTINDVYNTSALWKFAY